MGCAGDVFARRGSFGFQLGGQATDLVRLVVNSRGLNALLRS